MKPSTWDRQLGMVSPLKSAAIQSGQTNDPSKNEVGLDVSHHIHLSLEGRGKYFFLDILFHRIGYLLKSIWSEPCSTGSPGTPATVTFPLLAQCAAKFDTIVAPRYDEKRMERLIQDI